MEYTVNVGNHYMTYEGTPEEIATLIHYEENGIDINGEFLSKKELIYDQDEAVEFIKAKFEEDGQSEVTNGVIRKLLDADEDYMRSKGIIEE